MTPGRRVRARRLASREADLLLDGPVTQFEDLGERRRLQRPPEQNLGRV